MPEMKLHLPPTIAANIEQFTGRTWLLPTLLTWYEQTSERLFLLTGGPGTGKSMIMAWLAGAGPTPANVEENKQLEHLCAQVKAIHFCVAASGSTDPKELARQMAGQLTRNVPGFGRALAATMGDQVQIAPEQHVGRVEKGGSVTGVYIANLNLGGLSEELSFNRILRDPLKRLYEDSYNEPMLLLVDALDEAMTYTGSMNIVHLLAKLTDLPPQVRILATTRPDPRVLMLLPKVRLFDLIEDAPQDVNDVKQYVLERLAAKGSLDSEARTLLATRLSQSAQGIFLYAYMVVGDLLPRLPQIPDLETYPLPNGLSGLYRDFLNRELGQDDDRWYESFKPVLGLLAVAQGEGLTQTQMKQICRKDVELPLRKCEQYLIGELPEGPFRVFHKSFADFLLDDLDNVHRHIDASTMHEQIADYYQVYLDTSRDKIDGYALRYVSYHLWSAGSNHHEHLFQLIDIGWRRLKLERLHSDSSFMQDVENAIRAARDEAIDGLPRYLGLSLMAGSIATKSNDILPEVIGAMVALGQYERAEAYLQTMSERGVRSGALLQMARCYWLQNKRDQAQDCFKRALGTGKEADGIYMNPGPLIGDLLQMKLYQEAVAVVDLLHTRMKTAWNGMLKESERRLVDYLRKMCPEMINEFRDTYPATFGRLVHVDGSIDLTCVPTRLEYRDHPILSPPAEQIDLFRHCYAGLDAANAAIERNDYKEAMHQLAVVENWGRSSNWSLHEYGLSRASASEPWWRLLQARGLIGPKREFDQLRAGLLEQIAVWGESGWVARYAYGAALGELAIQLVLDGQLTRSEELISDALAYCETIGGMEASVDRCKADLANLLCISGYQELADAVCDTYVMEPKELASPCSQSNENHDNLVLGLWRVADQWPIDMPVNAWRGHHRVQEILNSDDPQIIRRGVQSGAMNAALLSEALWSLGMNSNETLALLEQNDDWIRAGLEQYVDLVTAGEWEATRYLWHERYPGVLYCGIILDYVATRNRDWAIDFLHRFFDIARRNGRHACWVHLIASVPTLFRLSPDMQGRVWELVEPIERWHQKSVLIGQPVR